MEYPKWAEGMTKDEFNQDVAVRLTVESAEEEKAVKDKTALYSLVKSAQGDTWRYVGQAPKTKKK